MCADSKRALLMRKEKSVKKNFIYNSAYQILAILVPLVTTPYVSRVLGADGVGRYSYAYTVAYYFFMFAMLGVNNYGNRSIAQTRDDREKMSYTFSSIYAFQLMTTAAMVILYCGYSFFLSKDRTISLIMLMYVASAGLDVNWLFFGIEEFRITTIRNTVIKLATVMAVFLFVKTKNDVYIYTAIYAASMLISHLILWTLVHRIVDFKRVGLKDIIPHIKPNLVLFVPVIAISLYKFMDKLMLGHMTNKAEVGYYESCDKIIQVPVALVSSLGTVMLPKISNLVANKQKERSEDYFKKAMLFAMFLSSSMGFGIMGVAAEFVPIFYGPGFEKCIMIFWILLPSCIFMGMANVVRTQYLIPYKKDVVYVASVFTGAIVNLIINTMLIPGMQSYGAAVGTICAEASVCIVQSLAVRKEIKVLQYELMGVPFVLAGLIMYLCLINLHLASLGGVQLLALKVVLGALIYLAVVAPYLFRLRRIL